MAAKAKAAGAKGFKLVGCTCVGQDLQLRGAHYTEIFDGHAGNNYISEAVLSCGAIDAVLSEFNCTLPGIETVCEELKIKQICLDVVAKKANAEYIPFNYETREADGDRIIDEIIAAYTARRGTVPMNLFTDHGNKNTLTSVAYGHDTLTAALTKELIARDILVLTAGCSSGGLENIGLMTPEAADLAGPNLRAVCKELGIPPVLNFGPCLAIGRLEIVATEIASELGVDLPQLPLVLSAAQWLEEQALADGAFALALGLPLHLGVPPFITGSKLVTKVLTEDMLSLTGGRVIIDGDGKSAADKLEAIIEEKRRALNI